MKNNYIAVFKESDLDQYLSNISTIKMLSEEEEKSLTTHFYLNKDKQSANKLVVSHLPLVVKIAYSYKGYGLNLMDLISEGNIGLLKAVTKFEPQKGYRLSTYAMWWIKAYITDYILNSWSLVKTTTLSARKKLFFSLNKVKKKLSIQTSSITEEQAGFIAKETGISKTDVIEVNNMLYNRDAYLDASLTKDENSITLADTIENTEENPEELYIEKEQAQNAKESVSKALSILNDREKEIILKRYMQSKPLSLDALGKSLNISRERVRQIEVKALSKAKTFLLENKNKAQEVNYAC